MSLVTGSDALSRCGWSDAAPGFEHYHDNEWGFPVSDNIRLFEKVCLESFQSGLSWRTILDKRENFRTAFKGFDYHQEAQFSDKDVETLMQNAGIVRNKGKILATINNAHRAIELEKDAGSLAKYFWSFEPQHPEKFEPQTQTTSKESIQLAKDLKKRGWKFVGPTTAFAFIQAMGLINDHAIGCVIREKAEEARRAFVRP